MRFWASMGFILVNCVLDGEESLESCSDFGLQHGLDKRSPHGDLGDPSSRSCYILFLIFFYYGFVSIHLLP